MDRYFLDSATNTSCFFEEEAFGPDGELRQVAHDLGLAQPEIWQSMYIFKQPGIGGEVGWHQNATFFETLSISVTTFWFALEDATVHNGCLWTQPGAHRGPLRERFVRHGDGVNMQKLSTTPWPDNTGAIPLEVKAGALFVFHGLLPHYSAPNRSSASRHAYTLHVTDATAHFSAANWIQRGAAQPVSGF